MDVAILYGLVIYFQIFIISREEGRGHWAVDYTSPQSLNKVFLFVSLTTLGTFIEIWLIGSVSWVSKRLNQ